ncbi:UDP-N-acetylmuramoyl-tripeptide--D-alanyl-D-alanine ligase [Neoehrlichia mikurensis]|uniref:UDP-N-acetylmuramoyl-tripeptide--D-alanyl-D-alanine ligase n=1 Tax=Neoehrlichia mikurensis TaxID=89586 RepID=A0A9Q9BZX8_9RICK|nr:UDP-N-acetylmuramoyl-tripeptide--D-alanyl-D-alanine ligase [Neoehrlichia mikurensis]QXK91867.1 UDP-N-acetylmuramoyl-tripeptide--D-alanyl-D-alanine ligase [Neoehrlichia mikurensis]QXK93080.1 UDP-N-acetylmuramoyl-tripeptide--D-alanyl-D-alanine ligase [Neoehrlichia mikurensis]QXK93560.1 UDP-N-acetylmuramoyl-tripeptide--D-alanyl-D-alanine ligase [Neoehrlichia mikurensis]UTO55485.1 UDP-N-acetylmuramoyl-tripeptide--D-alanyl-D-alanine ligase [Neoehrlichia mikurensis]UTO56406.1 UDP-N-acetylmuramoyl
MFYWDSQNIVNIIGGKAIGNKWICYGKISIDTRTLNSGDIFVAIKGKNFDGHDFIDEAFRKGAVAAIVDYRYTIYTNYSLIVVHNVLNALQSMASFYLKYLNAKVIAITGSIGKTTMKCMLQQVLSHYGNVYSDKGNFNNHIGMPLCALNAPYNSKFVILEMGMSNFGEIALLSKIASPDVSIITHITPAHLASFSSLEDIAVAKSEIFYHMKDNGIVILNYDNSYYNKLFNTAIQCCKNFNIISFGKNKNANIFLYTIEDYSNGLKEVIVNCKGNIIKCLIQESMLRFIYLILAVVAVIDGLKLNFDGIYSALKNFLPINGRGKINYLNLQGKSFILIDDSYNASPVSMITALQDLHRLYHDGITGKIAILGDMLELGDHSIMYHKKLIDFIVQGKISIVYTVGIHMKSLYDILPANIKGEHFQDYKALMSKILLIIDEGYVVLIKGSAATKLSIVVQYLLKISSVFNYTKSL